MDDQPGGKRGEDLGHRTLVGGQREGGCIRGHRSSIACCRVNSYGSSVVFGA